MLGDARVATRLPAQDLARARGFSAERLGLEPSEERPGGRLYRCAAGEFALFQTSGAPSGSHTQPRWPGTTRARAAPASGRRGCATARAT
jgi:hypothetical protein